MLVRPFCYALAAFTLVGCYRGGEREKDPPPGYAGGFCLAPTASAPQPHCEGDSLCDLDGAFCYDPTDPCRGFFCGGSDRGLCMPDQMGLPTCVCAPGFNNASWALYCCPEGGFGDEICVGAIHEPDEPRSGPAPDVG